MWAGAFSVFISFHVLFLCFTFHVSLSLIRPQGSGPGLARSRPLMSHYGRCLAAAWERGSLQPPGPMALSLVKTPCTILSHWVWVRTWKSVFVTRSPRDPIAGVLGGEGRTLCQTPSSCSSRCRAQARCQNAARLGGSCHPGLGMFLIGRSLDSHTALGPSPKACSLGRCF